MLIKRYFKTKEEVEVTFEYESESAEAVALVSEANNWAPVKMSQRKKDGIFYTKVRLPKDEQYQYRYLVDGQNWENDSAADSYIQNEFGGENSIVDTTDPAN